MNLAASILRTIKNGVLDSDFISHLLTKDRTKAKNKNEGEYWDYKVSVNLGIESDVSKLAKRVLGFFNNKGGVIIYGIDDNYIVRGIPQEFIVDTKMLHDKLRPYVGPRVSVFQDSIELKDGKLLWVICVPKREGLPVALQKNGPPDAEGRVSLKKNSFFLRVNDEIKTCLDPVDLCSLFADLDASLQAAYAFDIDEPYFRLLAHHCDRFVGRQTVLDDVREVLTLRHPIISFDGLGGVGKSAIAIELTRQLYDSKEYQFIVSLSAKSRVWQGHVATRIAGFSGITEFLREIGHVLGVGGNKSLEELKTNIVSLMGGIRGLILVDNIEDVHDEQILRFISREIPDPVKVIVTSRIDRGLGAISVPIPEMTGEEARELFEHELTRQGYARKATDTNSIKRILEATGRLPLAIKWAASLAAREGSLSRAEKVFEGTPAEKTEFLSFCFKTMFDQLPLLAKQVAILRPYLDESWTLPILSIALDTSEHDICNAVHELKDRGIALATSGSIEQMPKILPLTHDFLAAKLREDRSIEELVEARLAKALGDANPLVAGIGSSRRLELIISAIKKKLNDSDWDEAERLLHYALDIWGGHSDSWLTFLNGQLEFVHGKHKDGRELMESAVRNVTNEEVKVELEERIGLLLIHADSREERQAGANYLSKAIAKGADVPVTAIAQIAEISLRQNDYQTIRTLCGCKLTPLQSLEFVRKLDPATNRDPQFPYHIGRSLIDVYEAAGRSKSQDLGDEERTRINERLSFFKVRIGLEQR